MISRLTSRFLRLHPGFLAICLVGLGCTRSDAQGTGHWDHDEGLEASGQISDYVREVFQDREGVYWFGTNDEGVARFDGESLSYLRVQDGFGGNAVRGIVQGSDSDMWFATDGGVSRLSSGEFTNYTTEHGLNDNQVWCLLQDRSGTIWAGTHRGVSRFDGVSFVPFPLPRPQIDHASSRFSSSVVFCMTEDQDGHLWFGTGGGGIHRFDGKSFSSYSTEDGLAGNDVRSVYADRQGRIWIGTDGGGVSCLQDGVFHNLTEEDGLNNNRIYEILQDKAGNMWFSTLGAGASRYDGESFTAFREDHSLMINGFPARGHVQEFFEDQDGVLWLGCSGGLFRFDGTTFVNVKRDGPWPPSAKVSEPAAPTP